MILVTRKRYFSPFENILRSYEEPNGTNTKYIFSICRYCYGNFNVKCQPDMEKATGLKLYPAYTYARIYKKGDELKRHKDRFSCEISTTMNLGGDDWPIYLEPNENVIPGVNEPIEEYKRLIKNLKVLK